MSDNLYRELVERYRESLEKMQAMHVEETEKLAASKNKADWATGFETGFVAALGFAIHELHILTDSAKSGDSNAI